MGIFGSKLLYFRKYRYTNLRSANRSLNHNLSMREISNKIRQVLHGSEFVSSQFSELSESNFTEFRDIIGVDDDDDDVQ